MSARKLLEDFNALRVQIRDRMLSYCSPRIRKNPNQCLKLYNDMKRFYMEIKKLDDPEYVRLYVENLVPVMQFALMKRERNTFRTYFKVLWSYTKFLVKEKCHIFDVDMDVLNRYFTIWLNAEYKEMNTLSLHSKVLRIFYNYYGKREVVDMLKRMRFKDVLKFKVDLSDEEYEKIYNSISDLRVKLAVELIAGSGLRPGEALGITWGDINTKTDPWMVYIRYIPNSPYGAKGESGEGWVPITKRASKLIQYLRKIYIEKYAADPMLVDKGGRIINISYRHTVRLFNRAVEKAGIKKKYPLTLHKLRHYFAHRWRRTVRDIAELKSILRHSNINITMIYAEPTEDEIISDFKKVDRE